MSKLGRPYKSKRRNTKLELCVSEEEKALIEKLALNENKSVSQFIRDILGLKDF